MDIRYIAGYFDGEGCIGIYATHSKGCYNGIRFDLKIFLTSGDRDILEKMHTKCGGFFNPKPYHRPKRIPLYCVMWQAKSAYLFMKKIVKYSISKKEQIQLAIKYYEEFGGNRGSKMGKLHKRKMEYVIQMKALKRR